MTKSHRSAEGQSSDPADSDFETSAREAAEMTGEIGDLAELQENDEVTGGVAGSAEMSALDAQKDRYMRLAAEYDNYRKRTTRELQQASVRGQGDVIKGLLDSLDDLIRVAHIDPSTTDASSVVQGVALVERNVIKALEGYGLEMIDPVDLPFDPNLHEALSTQPTNVSEDDHKVAQVYQRGYLLKGQLLRPARVVVKQYQ